MGARLQLLRLLGLTALPLAAHAFLSFPPRQPPGEL
jgi:hypothetical protein